MAKPYIGKINKVFVKNIPEDNFGNTYRYAISVTIDGKDVWIGLGTGKQDKLTVQEGKKWVEVGDGTEIILPYEIKGQYYNAKRSKMVVSELVAPVPYQGSGGGSNASGVATGASGGSKFDKTGMLVGHAINAAMNFLKDKPKNFKQLTEVAIELHEITTSVKAKYAADNPSMSEYDSGAASGHAVLNACKIAKTLDEVEEYALKILSGVVPVVEEYIRAPKEEEQKEQQEEDSSDDGEEEQEEGHLSDDFDDDIPF